MAEIVVVDHKRRYGIPGNIFKNPSLVGVNDIPLYATAGQRLGMIMKGWKNQTTDQKISIWRKVIDVLPNAGLKPPRNAFGRKKRSSSISKPQLKKCKSGQRRSKKTGRCVPFQYITAEEIKAGCKDQNISEEGVAELMRHIQARKDTNTPLGPKFWKNLRGNSCAENAWKKLKKGRQ